MKITKRQLQNLIHEAMTPSVPDVVGAITGVPGGNIQNLVDEYKEWATEYMGAPSGANSSSVLATFIVDKGLDQTDIGDDIIKDMALAMKFGTSDVKRAVTQARKEHDAGGTLSDQESHDRSFYESVLRKLIQKKKAPLNEAWNDTITNMFADLLDWMQEAYEERQEEAAKAAGAREAPPPDESTLAAYAEMFDIDASEMPKVWESWKSPTDEKTHYMTALVIGATVSTDEGVLGEGMKALQEVEPLLKEMQSDDPEKSKEAAKKANEALGTALASCAGWADNQATLGEIGKHWDAFSKAATKAVGEDGMAPSAIALTQFGDGCDKTVEIATKALEGFDPSLSLIHI